MNLQDSKTKENLMRAFVGESQARNRYNFAAELAKQEKLQLIEQLFNYTADQEKAHAKVFYDALKDFSGNNISLGSASYPVDVYNTTLEYLKAAQKHELAEWDTIYKDFGKVAQEEGFPQIATTFNNIAEIEKVHSDRFGRFAQEIEAGTLFKKPDEVQWLCLHCGFVYEGTEAPKVCPVCSHPQGYYILFQNSPFE